MSTDFGFEEFGSNSGLVKELYEQYRIDRNLVGENWAQYFDTLRAEIAPSKSNGTNGVPQIVYENVVDTDAQRKVYQLIDAYRTRGHLLANINPLSTIDVPLPVANDLDLAWYNFTGEELETLYSVGGFLGESKLTINALYSLLRKYYCGAAGFEFMHLHDIEQRNWLQERIEQRHSDLDDLTISQRLKILENLIHAEHFENELHKKYIGHKRFSLEGGETAIPMLLFLIELGASNGLSEAILGMPHRGRLNVLVNVLRKPLERILDEFEDQSLFSSLGSGDVKYHLGYQSDYEAENGTLVGLTLACNPSHLEFVHPVVEGVARAKQDIFYNRDRSSVLPIILHGDAACIGQGVVAETLNFSAVRGYRTGGSIHLVVNNQVGFTTYPSESRSAPYASEWAKAVQSPVFHVNVENPETACWAMQLAFEYRQKFQRDVVIDLYCYRKYGHNEGDDPSYTQPVMYKEIKEKEKISTIYSNQLISQGLISKEKSDEIIQNYLDEFEATYSTRTEKPIVEACAVHGRIHPSALKTSTSLETLKHIAHSFIEMPEGFVPHPKLIKILENRIKIIEESERIDWAFAEALSFGSLLLDGIGIRLSGQDCIRGTFSQRHLGLRHYETGELFYPLKQFTHNGSQFEVYNSTLSEAAVMGFEFGYSSVAKKTLTMWEAQFGDFANGAQVIIDQFISASEAKWDQLSGLVLLLPHGYEGQGPEHSSARLERYLQLAAEGNMTICNPTTASQYFHLLRRQGLSPISRPLIVMTPKSLLRSHDASSGLDYMTTGDFREILIRKVSNDADVKSVVFATGKVCYDIRDAMRKLDHRNTTLVRLEQLYPLPEEQIRQVLGRFKNAKTFIWAQEEPRNMGSWSFMHTTFDQLFDIDLEYIGRAEAASTAAGSSKRHALEQAQLISECMKLVQQAL